MITRFGLIKRNASLSHEQFDRHWRDVHGPLAAGLSGLRAYFQHTVQARGEHPILGTWDLDGISELHFDTRDTMTAAFTSSAGVEARHDLGEFLADARMIVCELSLIHI